MAFENAKAAEASLAETKSQRYPTFEFGARQGIYKNTNSFDSGIDSGSYGDESLVELRMKYNLYRGGSDRAAERAAHRRINQAEDLRDKACVDLRQTATIAYSDVQNLTQQVKSLYMHKSAQEKVLVAYKEQFDIGRRSLLDVLDAENESFQAERAHVNGRFDLTQAKFRTLHSMGYLLQTLSVDRKNIPSLDDLWEGDPVESATNYCTVNDSAYVRSIKLGPLSSATDVKRVELSSDALFDVGSAVIREQSVGSLERFVATLKGQPVRQIMITGHTDSTGTDALNRKLSLERAMAVRTFLMQQGVQAERIDTQGRGSSEPIASESTVAGRAQNWRVELHIQP